MDIDLMSKMVKELIQNREEVCLQGVGSFITEIIPSSFSDRGYTINPPYRRLVFRQKENPGDRALVNLYAEANGIDTDRANLIIRNFLEEMREVLETKKTVVLPGLGRLRATRENNFFFVADEDLDIWPDGFGLEPISLKTHVETTDEVSAAVSELKEILDAAGGTDTEVIATTSESESTMQATASEATAREEEASEATIVGEVELEENSSAESTMQATASEEANETKTESTSAKDTAKSTSKPTVNPTSKTLKRIGRITGTVLVVFIILLAAFVLLSRFAPEFIDSILYNKEDLEFLRNQNII